MVRLSTLAGATLLAGSTAYAQIVAIVPDCGVGIGNCKEDKACCSQYGQCGIGAFCLGGCDPVHSFSYKSCVPEPQCQSKTYSFTSDTSSPVTPDTKYLGDATKSDWVSDGQPLFANDVMYLTMAPNTVGTVVASARYVWYGKISATMKTSRGQGVVTAFIMMSDVKDEIDYEWVGVDLQTSQTNFYWNGIPNYTHSANITMEGNTFDDWHTYTIDWTPDQIQWSVDGQVGRTLLKTDTYNATTGNWEFPQTPSRIQLSLWPGGLASNGQGTISWAGGLINWDGEDIQEHGYYYAQVSEVVVECYDPPSGAQGSGTNAYEWLNTNALNTSVDMTNDGTVLNSFLGTGTNLTAELPSAVTSATTVVETVNGKATTIVSTLQPTGTNGAETVPGLSGAGTNSGDLSSQPGDDGSDGSGSASGTAGGSESTATGWSQDGSSSKPSSAPRLLGFGDKWLVWGNVIAILAVAGTMITL